MGSPGGARALKALLACTVAAALSAAVTRMLMWAVAVTVNVETHFTWTGSLLIFLAYFVFSAPGAVALALSRGRWPWVLAGAGIAVLGWNAVLIGLQETAGASAMTGWRWAQLIVLLTAMAAVYVAQFTWLLRRARTLVALQPSPADHPMRTGRR